MLGRTHVPVGITTALLVTQPSSVSGVIGAVAGGAIGVWICDIDVKDPSENEGVILGFVFMAIDVGIALLVDYLLGNGICDDFVNTWGVIKIVASLLFVVGCVFGFLSIHRTFMHSILAIVFFSGMMYLICTPLAIPFAVGYASHIVLDIFNRRGLQLFYPFKAKVSLGICDSDGKTNNVIGGIAIISSIVLTVWFSLIALQNEPVLHRYAQSFRHSNVSPSGNSLIKYLIIINIVSFLAYTIDYLMCRFDVVSEDSEDSLHDFLNLFAYAGGSLGALVALILFTKKGRANAYWFIKIISVLVVWIFLLLMLFDPFNLGFGNIDRRLSSHIPLIIYLFVINVIAVVLFIKDRFRRRSDINAAEFLLIVVGFIGGALGGYIVMVLTNGKRSFPHFAVGFPVMIAIQAFVIIYLLNIGVV